MAATPLRILHVNTYDAAGGAEKIARYICEGERARGHRSWLAVGTKRGGDPQVLEIPRLPEAEVRWPARLARRLYTGLKPWDGRVRGARRLREFLLSTHDWPTVERALGREDFHFPGSRGLLRLAPEPPDIVHAHNLHTGYFDLRYLPRLSRERPVVLTLHDQWTMTGHCGFSGACEGWRSGCWHCPDLSLYPPIEADGAHFNRRRKARLYAASRLHVAAPTQWLMDMLGQSILAPAVQEARLIRHGIDVRVFQPGDQAQARAALGLAQDAQVAVFAANYVRYNPRKDYATVRTAMLTLAEQQPESKWVFIAIGERDLEGSTERLGPAEMWIVPFLEDPQSVARYFQAADVYVHGARADNQPLAVLEALACGTPVVATNVGGIPELVAEGERGHLVAPGDAAGMAARLKSLFDQPEVRARMGEQGTAFVQQHFDDRDTVTNYLDWYAAILEGRRRGPAGANRASP